MKRIILASSLLLVSLFAFTTLFVGNKVSADDLFNEVCTADTQNSTVCSDVDNPGNPITGKEGLIAKAVSLLSWVIGVASTIMLLYGGYKYVTSSGDSAKVNVAKETVLYAVIGLAVAISARAIIVFVLNK